jgi:hypothetical protein
MSSENGMTLAVHHRRDRFAIIGENKDMAEENTTGSNLIWAVTTIIVVAMIVGAVYYSGFLRGTKKHEVDVEISVPSR